VLVLATRAFLSIPGIGKRNFQGPRSLVLVFTLGIVLK